MHGHDREAARLVRYGERLNTIQSEGPDEISEVSYEGDPSTLHSNPFKDHKNSLTEQIGKTNKKILKKLKFIIKIDFFV